MGRERPTYLARDRLRLVQQLEVPGVPVRIVEELEAGLMCPPSSIARLMTGRVSRLPSPQIEMNQGSSCFDWEIIAR